MYEFMSDIKKVDLGGGGGEYIFVYMYICLFIFLFCMRYINFVFHMDMYICKIQMNL